jgi:Tol biopolymer transport system component
MGADQRQLTDNTYNATRPSVSPDGRYVVFASDRAGAFNIWRIDAGGSNLKQLTSGGGFQPYCSPDGQGVVYTSVNIEQQTLGRCLLMVASRGN